MRVGRVAHTGSSRYECAVIGAPAGRLMASRRLGEEQLAGAAREMLGSRTGLNRGLIYYDA